MDALQARARVAGGRWYHKLYPFQKTMHMEQSLLIFAKNLIPGRGKTRLAATIGNEAALSVYKRLLQHTASITKELPVRKTVFYSDFIEASDIWESRNYQKQLQWGNDLGERMKNAFEFSFNQGIKETAVIGTDCFELSDVAIVHAFTFLKIHDIVIGPARDGGYYLLAMKEDHPQLFENIRWSTGEVLEQTLSVCERLNLSVYLLPALVDIDTEDDLRLFESRSSQPNF